MEDVDQTIIPILVDLGCSFKSVTSINDFTTQHIVEAVSHSLFAINNKHKFPTKLPSGNAQRFRICSQIAGVFADLGYTGEIGYQTFMYPNPKDMRKLLMWLIDKVPKTTATEDADDVIGSGGDFESTVRSTLKQWASQRWDPVVNTGKISGGRLPVATTALCLPEKNSVPETQAYYEQYQPVLPQQCGGRKLAPSVFEFNTIDIVLAQEKEQEWEAGDVEQARQKRQTAVKGMVAEAFRLSAQHAEEAASRGRTLTDMFGDAMTSYNTQFGRRRDYGHEEEVQAQVVHGTTVTNVSGDGEAVEDEDEDALRQKREAELAEVQARIDALQVEIATLENLGQQSMATARHLEAELATVGEETMELEKTYKVKKNTLSLLPDAKNNLIRLQELTQKSAAHLVTLGEEWERHRGPLVERYRRQKQLLGDRKEQARSKLEKIKRMRAEMKVLSTDVREKEVRHKQVLEELNRLPKSINRQVYVRRIMDIVKNLNRQKADIRKVLGDVRVLQKDINMVSETSKRSFAVADETIFRAASRSDPKDNSAKQAYKCLDSLRKGFDKLVQLVEDMGRTRNEIRDLHSRIDALESRNTGQNMERIKKDLTQVKKENQQLTDALKKGGAKV